MGLSFLVLHPCTFLPRFWSEDTCLSSCTCADGMLASGFAEYWPKMEDCWKFKDVGSDSGSRFRGAELSCSRGDFRTLAVPNLGSSSRSNSGFLVFYPPEGLAKVEFHARQTPSVQVFGPLWQDCGFQSQVCDSGLPGFQSDCVQRFEQSPQIQSYTPTAGAIRHPPCRNKLYSYPVESFLRHADSRRRPLPSDFLPSFRRGHLKIKLGMHTLTSPGP